MTEQTKQTPRPVCALPLTLLPPLALCPSCGHEARRHQRARTEADASAERQREALDAARLKQAAALMVATHGRVDTASTDGSLVLFAKWEAMADVANRVLVVELTDAGALLRLQRR